jgi:hypothetical protein
MNYTRIFEFNEKGNFFFTEGEVGYDIYFVPSKGIEMKYVSTVDDVYRAQTHCALYQMHHNRFIGENEIIRKIAKEIHHLEMTDKEDEIRARLEKQIPYLEEILGRPLTSKDVDDYITDIVEFYI